MLCPTVRIKVYTVVRTLWHLLRGGCWEIYYMWPMLHNRNRTNVLLTIIDNTWHYPNYLYTYNCLQRALHTLNSSKDHRLRRHDMMSCTSTDMMYCSIWHGSTSCTFRKKSKSKHAVAEVWNKRVQKAQYMLLCNIPCPKTADSDHDL